MSGKKVRLNRFQYRNSARGLIVPIDHGLTLGPISGLSNIREMGTWINHPAICGVIAHKGTAERLGEAGLLRGLGLMVHLNGMASFSTKADTKERLTSIETAIRLGADGVSFQVNFTGDNDVENLTTMGQIVDEAARYDLPVLAMVYDKVKAEDRSQSLKRLRHLVRVSIELGCDAIKLAPPAAVGEVETLLSGLNEDISIFFAGGELGEVEVLYEQARVYSELGAAGLCVGRNIFQRNDAGLVLSELKAILDPAPIRVTEYAEAGAAYGH